MQVTDSQALLNSRTEDLSADLSGNAEIEEENAKDGLVNRFSDAVAAANDGDLIKERQSEAPGPPLPAGPAKGMPAVGHTTDFPRADNLYRKKESLPYDES